MRLRTALILLFLGWFGLVATPAWSISQPHPEPADVMTIRGFLKGRLGEDRDVRFALIAAHPDGWFRLQSITVALLLHGQPIQDIAFDVSDQTLSVAGGQPVPLGSGAPDIPGGFVGAKPSRTRFIRSTFSVRLEVRLYSTADIPPDAIFRMIARDDEDNAATALRRPQLGRGFLSWSTLAIAVAVALFVGAFAGNTFSSKRYKQREPSIWDIVERRLKEQKARPPALAPPTPIGPSTPVGAG